MRRVRATIVAVERQLVLHNLSICVFVELGVQDAMRMRHIIIVACPAVQYFSTLSH